MVVTGGSAQLPGLPERLSALVGVPVEPAYMHDLLRIGDIGFAPEELPRLEPYLPAPVGLALGGANVGVVVDLMPKRRRSAVTQGRRARRPDDSSQRVSRPSLVLGGLTYLGHHNVASAKAKQVDAETAVKKLQSQIARRDAGTRRERVRLRAAVRREVDPLRRRVLAVDDRQHRQRSFPRASG